MGLEHRQTGEAERIAFRRAIVMTLRGRGKTTRQIHEEWIEKCNNDLGPEYRCAVSTIQNDIKASLDNLAEQEKLGAEQARQLIIQRVDQLWGQPRFQEMLEKGNLQAYDRADKLLDKYAKLYGAYAPTKIAQTDPEGKDLDRMSEEEREQKFLELLAKAEERRVLAEGG